MSNLWFKVSCAVFGAVEIVFVAGDAFRDVGQPPFVAWAAFGDADQQFWKIVRAQHDSFVQTKSMGKIRFREQTGLTFWNLMVGYVGIMVKSFF